MCRFPPGPLRAFGTNPFSLNTGAARRPLARFLYPAAGMTTTYSVLAPGRRASRLNPSDTLARFEPCEPTYLRRNRAGRRIVALRIGPNFIAARLDDGTTFLAGDPNARRAKRLRPRVPGSFQAIADHAWRVALADLAVITYR